MNRRTFMRLLPALSAFPSIAEAVVESQSVTTSMGVFQYLRLNPTSAGAFWWHKPHWTMEEFDKLMKEAFKYSGMPKMYYLNGEWHGR